MARLPCPALEGLEFDLLDLAPFACGMPLADDPFVEGLVLGGGAASLSDSSFTALLILDFPLSFVVEAASGFSFSPTDS